MGESTEYVAVVDRFEGDEAVLLLERNGETVGDLVVSSDCLPSDARTQDAVVLVAIDDDGDLVDARFDHDETERREERAQSRFDRLAERPPDASSDDTADTDATNTDAPDRDARDENDTGGEADDAEDENDADEPETTE